MMYFPKNGQGMETFSRNGCCCALGKHFYHSRSQGSTFLFHYVESGAAATRFNRLPNETRALGTRMIIYSVDSASEADCF